MLSYLARNQSPSAKCTIHTVIWKADRWLSERRDIVKIIKGNTKRNPQLHAYCFDLYNNMKLGASAFIVHPKSEILWQLLATNAPPLNGFATWLSQKQRATEHSYFMYECPKNERAWWQEMEEKHKQDGLGQETKAHVSDKARQDLIDKLIEVMYEACLKPSREHNSVVKQVIKLVSESPQLCKDLAHQRSFVASLVTLMAIGEEPLQITCAILVGVLADEHYSTKVLVGELEGFHALTDLLKFGSIKARKAGVRTISALTYAEENWRKVLVAGTPEVLIRALSEEGEGLLVSCNKVFNHLGGFDLAWSRLFAATFEIMDSSTTLYNGVMQALINIKHQEDMKMEYLEGNHSENRQL